jgi:hypothetical protein
LCLKDPDSNEDSKGKNLLLRGNARALGACALIGLGFGALVGVFAFPFAGNLTWRRFAIGISLSALFGLIYGILLALTVFSRRLNRYPLLTMHVVAAFTGAGVATSWWFLSTPDVSLLTSQLVGALIGMLFIHGP